MPNLVTELTASCSVPNKVRSIARCLSWFGLAVDGILSWYIRPRVHEPWEFLTSPFYKSFNITCAQMHSSNSLQRQTEDHKKKIYLMHQSHSVHYIFTECSITETCFSHHSTLNKHILVFIEPKGAFSKIEIIW